MKPNNFLGVKEAHKGFEEGMLHAVIVFGIDLSIGWKNNQLCNIKTVQKIIEQSVGFALSKESPWKEALSHQIRKYKINGILDNIKRKYMALHCTQKTSNQPKQFGILYLSGACMLLMIGIIVSLLFFAIEHVINACVKRFSSNIPTHDRNAQDMDID